MNYGESACYRTPVRVTYQAWMRMWTSPGIGSTDFRTLSQKQRMDALLVIEQHRAWLDGLQQQVLAEVSAGDTSEDQWLKERSPARWVRPR
jgi:hypothetical protein